VFAGRRDFDASPAAPSGQAARCPISR
jgi:hypothetical protein